MNGQLIQAIGENTRMNRVTTTHRKAFTLIELLAVIAIIGVLMGILIPTISGVINTTKKGALKLEVDELARAVERYRDKYGDYPPDGSDWPTFERHIRKAFPQILASEIDLLNPANNPAASNPFAYQVRNSSDVRVTTGNGFTASELKVMDSAEALVFFLGGFSSDAKRPFTGRGGPFLTYTGTGATAGQIHYNVSRENSFFNFDAGRLTLTSGTSGSNPVPVVSSDEETFFGGTPDLFPVYLSRFTAVEESSPYVYFDSRTYISRKKDAPYFNFYQRTPVGDGIASDPNMYGAVYPMYSDTANSANKFQPGITTANLTTFGRFVTKQFMEPTKFQIFGPGLDGKYGGRLVAVIEADTNKVLALSETMFTFPTGDAVEKYNRFPSPDSGFQPNQPFRVTPVRGTPNGDVDPRYIVRILDNVSNFSAATLDAGTP